MENTNQNSGAPQGGNLDAAKALFADYETQGDNKPKKLSKEEILAQYFTPRRTKEIFRILPPKAGRRHVETAFFHAVKTNSSDGKRWRKIYCPKHNDPEVAKVDANGNVVTDADGKPFMIPAPCPICDKKDDLLKKQDQSIRKIKKEDMNAQQLEIKKQNDQIYKDAMGFDAKKFYIVKGIDRDSTGDGVKFWRFKHNFKKQGIYDKLMPALQNFVEQAQVDFADPFKGTDLTISVVNNQIPGSSRTFKDVSNIMATGSKPLAEDELIRNQWLSDGKTWRDVFKPASAPELTETEFLDRVSRGTDPYWDDSDSNNKKWVFPDPRDYDKQEKMNNRDSSLGSNTDNFERKVEKASDVVGKSYDGVNINNVSKQDVGEYNDDAVDLSGGTDKAPENTPDEPTKQPEPQREQEQVTAGDDGDGDQDYDDLPF